jgi:hypothetical protein
MSELKVSEMAGLTISAPSSAAAPNTLEVYWTADEYDGVTSWIMYFRGVRGSLKFKFAIMYPNEHSVAAWEELAAGKQDFRCYHGNGEGGIQVVDGMLVFGAAPSGGGGDVSLTVAIPLAEVAEPLRAAVRTAIAEGMPFAAR